MKNEQGSHIGGEIIVLRLLRPAADPGGMAVCSCGMALFSPFLIALPIAAMLQPVTRFLETKLRMRHGAAAMLPVILLCAILVGLIIWFGSFGVNQVTYLLNNSGTIIRDEAGIIRTTFQRLNEKINEATGGRINLAAKENDQILIWITERASELGRKALSYVPGMAAGIPFAFVYLNT